MPFRKPSFPSSVSYIRMTCAPFSYTVWRSKSVRACIGAEETVSEGTVCNTGTRTYMHGQAQGGMHRHGKWAACSVCSPLVCTRGHLPRCKSCPSRCSSRDGSDARWVLQQTNDPPRQHYYVSGVDAGEITTTLLCNLEAQVAVKSGCVAASDRVNGEQSGFGESRIAGGKSKDG